MDGGFIVPAKVIVYHNDKKRMTEINVTFLLIEYRLLKYIMNPALIITYLFGIILIYENNYLLAENYFLLKLILVFILSLFHIYLSILYKDFKKGYRYKKTKFYRIINEIPTTLMIVIILLIVVKPSL